MKKQFVFLLLWMVLTAACSRMEPTIYTIALSPSNTHIVYIATMKGVYKSRDNGATWESRSDGLGDAHVISLAVDPYSPSTVYAGTFGDAIYRTSDGGQRWHSINLGLKGHVSVVNGFAFYPKDSKTILTATTVGVFKSTNEGGEWIEKVGEMESVYTVSIAIDPKNSDLVYAGTSGGIYKSADLGEHWQKKNDGLIKNEVGSAMGLGINNILIDPQQNTRLLLGTSLGVFQSMDGGDHWVQLANGVGSPFVIGLAIDPKNSRVIYAGTDNGVYKTSDGGETWIPKTGGLKSKVIRAIEIDRNQPQTLYAGTQGGLYKTTNGGEEWTLLKGYEKK
ncbi:MAG: hypothetical protein HYR81_03540 [Nitrospirae bacterium]|nr:hypothetical protein [Nitrospirota bacterium]